jgi:hypothetical protein
MDKKYGVSLENDQTSTIIDLNGIFVIFPFKIVLHNRLVYHFKSLLQIECFQSSIIAYRLFLIHHA